MVVSTQSSAVTYLGNGSTTVWPFSFPVPDASWLQVKTKNSTGVLSTIPANDYTVSGIGAAGGGTVTYPKSGSALATGTRIRIQRVVPIVQNVEIVNQEGYYPEVLEASADYRVFTDQQLSQRITDLEANDHW
jgi:hypothetical protein